MLSGFPLGFFVPASVSDLVRYFGMDGSNAGALGFFAEWLISASVGYFQWFVLVPWPWRKWKTWRAGV